MQSLKDMFNKLTPTGKAVFAIGGTILVVGTAVGLGMNAASPEQKQRAGQKPVVKAILTDEDPRALGLDALNSQLRQLASDQRRLERTVGKREEDEKLKKAEEKLSGLEEQVSLLQQELARVEREGGSKKGKAEEGHTESAKAQPVVPVRQQQFVQKATSSSDALSEVYSNLPPPTPIDPKARTSEKQEGPKIRTITNEKPKDEEKGDEEISITLPAGSILSGVLVTGMDAPTGQKAQKDPFPSLLRIKSEAILPNRFRADFRECLLIAGGWGDLSSERAYLRAERLSCVRNDGSVLEAPIEAFATGEDGKAGIRGRLVSKQGQILARSLMAGFMQGVASAFDVRQVPSINITRSNGAQDEVQSPVYEQAFDSNALQGAGVRGVGTALERIADFYLEMAEGMFPVIEIDAMRDVNFIVNKGMTVKFNANTLKVSDVN